MAETAKILSPDKKVLLPNINAGCLMADMINFNQMIEFKKKYPNIPIVCYINSTAEVKSECDICCTSSNAVEIVKSLNAPKVLFVPDANLGKYVESQLDGVEVITYQGCCPVHDNITVEDIAGAAFGLAGADVLSQKTELNRVLREIGFKNFALENDGILGVKAGSTTGYGVCSINGTGTVVVGVDNHNEFLQVGGVGYISGDEAGGAYLVRRTFQAIYDQLYRMGDKTVLTDEIFALYNIKEGKLFLDKIVELTEKRMIDRTTVIKILFKSAANGDKVAIGILEQAGICMGLAVAGCINNLNFTTTVPVVLAGSVWVKATTDHMLNAFKNIIFKHVKKECDFIMLNATPASGAIIWALEIANGKMPSLELRDQILKTIEEVQKELPTT